jgi:hypothetical protein
MARALLKTRYAAPVGVSHPLADGFLMYAELCDLVGKIALIGRQDDLSALDTTGAEFSGARHTFEFVVFRLTQGTSTHRSTHSGTAFHWGNSCAVLPVSRCIICIIPNLPDAPLA